MDAVALESPLSEFESALFTRPPTLVKSCATLHIMCITMFPKISSKHQQTTFKSYFSQVSSYSGVPAPTGIFHSRCSVMGLLWKPFR